MTSSALSCSYGPTRACLKHKVSTVCNYPHAKAQSFGDKGKSMNMVDANLGVLRERIEEVKTKYRLERCCRVEDGWYYPSGYDHKLKRDAKLSETLELVGLVGTAFGLVFLSGSLCLCLVSLVVHLSR